MNDRIIHLDNCPGTASNIKYISSKITPTKYHYCELCFSHWVERSEICCLNPSVQFVKYEIANGRLQLRQQCRNCFTLNGKNFKHSEVKDIHSLQPYVKQAESYWERTHHEGTKFYQWLAEKRKAAFFKQHDDYLGTHEWRHIRAAVLKRDNYICQGCLIVKASEVHHLTYDRWKNEMAFDLISLCTSCHKKIHQK